MKSKKLWKNIEKNSTPGTTPLHKSFFKVLNQNDLVIEIGSGSGRIIDLCINSGLRCIGIDINPNEVEFLKDKYSNKSNVVIMQHDITKLSPPKIKGAKAAIMLGLLGALDSIVQRKKAIENTLSVLDENGYVFISEFLYDDTNEILAERYERGRELGLEDGSFLVRNDDTSYITHNFKKNEIINLMSHYCTIIDFEIMEFSTFHGNRRPGIVMITKRK